jgi:hypothetical protein
MILREACPFFLTPTKLVTVDRMIFPTAFKDRQKKNIATKMRLGYDQDGRHSLVRGG